MVIQYVRLNINWNLKMNIEQKIQRCQALVIAFAGKTNAELWWNSYNEYFNAIPRLLPVDEVYNYLMTHSSESPQ